MTIDLISSQALADWLSASIFPIASAIDDGNTGGKIDCSQLFIPGYLPVETATVFLKKTRPEQKWKCGGCGQLHDDEFEANRCCPSEELWLCPTCDAEHDSEKEAIACCFESDDQEDDQQTVDFYRFPTTTDPKIYVREFCRINFLTN